MSNSILGSSSRTPFRSSHLRQVSSVTKPEDEALRSNISDSRNDTSLIKQSMKRTCSLSVHEETFSKDDILINVDYFHNSVKAGDLMQITRYNEAMTVLVNSNDPESQAKDENQEVKTSRERQTISRIPNTETQSVRDKQYIDKHEANIGKCYTFIVKDMSPDQKAKQPDLQVCEAIGSFLYWSNPKLFAGLRLKTNRHKLWAQESLSGYALHRKWTPRILDVSLRCADCPLWSNSRCIMPRT